ncbi:hypothetical protein C7293_31700 [filamentous cyanobacterium CCT1]|nr:hypothetical protein C7293_31700 [filamentous cyanobacterium CCT1]PSN75738.1 hypothetical protein C8B47_31005 [filamentous cyanobacterium CCP4]
MPKDNDSKPSRQQRQKSLVFLIGGLAAGIFIGAGIGFIISNMAAGIGVGLAVGAGIGGVLAALSYGGDLK